MSNSDRPLTERDLEPLLQALGQFFDGAGPALRAVSDQAQANTIVCAFLVREMTKAGLMDAEAIRQEALAVANGFDPPGSGAGIAKVITSIFGGEPSEAQTQVALRVIQGGLDRAAMERSAGQERKPNEPHGSGGQAG